MSLYDNISLGKTLSDKGFTGSISSGIGSVISGSSASGFLANATKSLGGGMFANAATGIAGNMAKNSAMNLVNKFIPIQARNALNVGAGAIGDIMSGNLDKAGMRLLDSGLLNDLLPGMSGVASQAKYWGTPTPLFGGISPTEALEIYGNMRGNKLAKKNLWLIEVSSQFMGDASQQFNMFATELDYAPLTITGEKRKIGSASVDSVNSSEPIELRLTTMDDQSGFVKYWFKAHCAMVASSDGTVGVPSDYAVRIKVVHAFITQKSNNNYGYEDCGLFRPANLEVNLSRREDGMQEVQMTFSQCDTFMSPPVSTPA